MKVQLMESSIKYLKKLIHYQAIQNLISKFFQSALIWLIITEAYCCQIKKKFAKSYVRDTRSYVRDTKSYIRHTKSSVRDTKSYVRDTKSYVRHIKSYVRDTKSYVRDTKSYVRHTKSYVRDNYVVRTT